MPSQRTDKRCPTCARFPDLTGREMTHWRNCVPRKQWPDFTKTPSTSTYACDCGYEGSSASGLRLHRLRSANHKAAVA